MADLIEQDVAAISEKLDRIIRLLALGAIRPDQSMKEKAITLSRVGLSPREIAALVGTTAHSVSQALSVAAKGTRKSAKKKPRKA